MLVPVESVVRSALRPYHLIIYDALTGGWGDYQNSSEAGRWRRKGTRAAIVWERCVDRAIAALVDDPDVFVLEHHDTVSFIVRDTVLWRFKKGDDHRLSRNVPTDLARLFHDHQADLFGYDGLHRVQVVYVLDRWEREIREIAVVARDDDTVLWHYVIDLRPTAEVLPFSPPSSPTVPWIPSSQPKTGDLARPKQGLVPDRKKSEDEE